MPLVTYNVNQLLALRTEEDLTAAYHEVRERAERDNLRVDRLPWLLQRRRDMLIHLPGRKTYKIVEVDERFWSEYGSDGLCLLGYDGYSPPALLFKPIPRKRR